MLDGLVVLCVVLLAGGGDALAVRLAIAMTLLQFAIGTINDLVDEHRDRGRSDKPIPAGVVAPGIARSLAAAFALAGVTLGLPIGPAAPVGLGAFVVGIVALAIGLLYDLRFRGGTWSWVPFAAGIPLLPVYGWLGATGTLPAAFLLLVPAGMAAGAGLAVGNALGDLERDLRAGAASVATGLGRGRAWLAHAVLLAAVAGIAMATLLWWGRALNPGGLIAGGGVAVIAAGIALAAVPRSAERAWALEAAGVAVLAVGWLLAIEVLEPAG
jgi:4-hydroxybenzoate polyprenyltransferase